MGSGKRLRIELPLAYLEALDATREALASEDFGVITEIDVRATLKEIGADFRPYIILGACNPSIAFMGLQRHLELGLLLPCNLIVYDSEGGSVVAIQDPGELLAVAENPDLREVAEIVRAHLERVLDALEARSALHARLGT